jgi:hypothetical protein
MVTCPRCGNPAILMASNEFKLLDCEFCDDVIDERPRTARARARAGRSNPGQVAGREWLHRASSASLKCSDTSGLLPADGTGEATTSGRCRLRSYTPALQPDPERAKRQWLPMDRRQVARRITLAQLKTSIYLLDRPTPPSSVGRAHPR